MLGIGWKEGVATIVDRRLISKTTEPNMGEFAGQGVEQFEFIADVEADDGSAHFRAPVKEPFNAITFKAPSVGQRVKVKLHSKDRKVKFDRDDDGTYQHVPGVPDWHRHEDPLREVDETEVAADHSAEAQARWEAQLNEVPGAAPAPPPTAVAQNDDPVTPPGRHLSMAELVELKKKVDSGEITEAEFEAMRSGSGSAAGD